MRHTAHTQSLELGLFEDFRQADAAIARLIHRGVAKERISVVCSKELPATPAGVERIEGSTVERRLPAALTGGAAGSVLGGLAAAAGIGLTGGLGLLVVGPVFATAAAAGVTGSFIGVMVSRGIEPDVADLYDQALRRGSILVSVEPPEDEDGPSQALVHDLLESYGAQPLEGLATS